MENIIFNDELDGFCNKYIFKGGLGEKTPHLFDLEHERISRNICEQLLRHDGVAIKVNGTNAPLAILINLFGERNLEELLEQNAIQFILWTPMVTTLASDNFPDGLLPLQFGNLSKDAVYGDPEKSIDEGFKILTRPIPRKQRRNLTRKLLKSYRLPSEEISSNAVTFGHDGYKNNKFSPLGFANTKEITKLNASERRTLLKFTNESLELAVISEMKLNTINNYNLMRLNELEFENLTKSKTIQDYQNKLFQLEQVPNFSEMIKLGMLDIESIPKVRSTKNAIKFRKWINNIADGDEDVEISKQYIESISNNKSKLDTTTGKITRSLVVTAVSGTVGTALAGPVGSLIGGGIGAFVINPALDFSIDMLDTFVLDGVLKGWNPKHYFDNDIKKIIQN
ncbi:hypothetical protein [Peribacillus frigoritolerans]|uniref:Uncharacterized protein n=1 Tax=Peribacillus castrilensis TaxID=2897690 RepID=A0AAW9N099_9BACI|nr:hypothetical protein [Peribacillus castrilensis]